MMDALEGERRRGFQHVSRFISAISEHLKVDAVYRGHANAGWGLVPSALRGQGVGIDNIDRLKGWKRVAARLANPRPTNDFEWLALAQHHGIATTLLDWTYNPLVALFFACGEPHEKDAAVWQVERAAFKRFERPETIEPFKQDRDLPGLIDASSMNARSIAQDSAMSLHPPGSSFQPNGEHGLIIYRVPSRDKLGARQALRTFGISEERLFVDLAVVVKDYRATLAIDGLLTAHRQSVGARREAGDSG